MEREGTWTEERDQTASTIEGEQYSSCYDHRDKEEINRDKGCRKLCNAVELVKTHGHKMVWLCLQTQKLACYSFVNERILNARLKLDKTYLTVVGVYAMEEEKVEDSDLFYE